MILGLALAAASVVACDSGAAKPIVPSGENAPVALAPTTATPAAESGLTRVEDVSQVCMVTNQFMGVAQIPIDVEGKTYFGCCEMCKARLAKEPETRNATDPVTGAAVDKATAVIAREAGGKVHYFATLDTLARYRATP